MNSFFLVDGFSRLTLQRLKSNINNFSFGQHVLQNVLFHSQMLLYWITLQSNGTFRVFYAKLYILLSVDGSTKCRNEIIFGGHYNYQIR